MTSKHVYQCREAPTVCKARKQHEKTSLLIFLAFVGGQGLSEETIMLRVYFQGNLQNGIMVIFSRKL